VQLTHTPVLSTGIVINRSTDIGDLIVSNSGKKLFILDQQNPLRVYVHVPESFATEVQVGTKADLSFDEFPGRLFPATVVTTSNAVDPTNRTHLVELHVPNPANAPERRLHGRKLTHYMPRCSLPGNRESPDLHTSSSDSNRRVPSLLGILPLKYTFISIVLSLVCFSFFSLEVKAQEEMFWGTIVRNPPANYVVRMDDGKILNAEWESGYDQWSIGERVILTTENDSGIMFFEDRRTQVPVFPYDPSEIGE
jgi:hypothetical protein